MTYYTKPTAIDNDEKIRLADLKELSTGIDGGFNMAEEDVISSSGGLIRGYYESSALPEKVKGAPETHSLPHGFGEVPSIIVVMMRFTAGYPTFGYVEGDEIVPSQDTSQSISNGISTYSDDQFIYVVIPSTGVYTLNRTNFTYEKIPYSSASVEFYVKAWV